MRDKVRDKVYKGSLKGYKNNKMILNRQMCNQYNSEFHQSIFTISNVNGNFSAV